MRTFSEIEKMIRKLKGLKTSAQVAGLLNVKPNTIATWKVRNKIPFVLLVAFCEAEEINFDWLLTGQGATYRKDRSFGPRRQNDYLVSAPPGPEYDGKYYNLVNNDCFKGVIEILLKHSPENRKILLKSILNLLETHI